MRGPSHLSVDSLADFFSILPTQNLGACLYSPSRPRLIEKLMSRPLSLTPLLAWIAFTAAAHPGAEGQAQAYRSDSTLKTVTEVVNVYTVVRDRSGRLVRDLQRADFQVTEDSVPQDVRYFSPATDAPLSLALAIDTTTCQDEALPIEKDAAKDFLREVLRPGDQAFVLRFGSRIEVLQGWTDDAALLARGIDQAQIEQRSSDAVVPKRPDGKIARGPHHLLDAVHVASSELLRSRLGLKVLIVLTDGYEQGSRASLDATLDAAQRADVIIYCIDVLDPLRLALPSLPDPGRAMLDKLAGQTGGRVIRVKPAYQTPGAFEEIAEELRSQYSLGYTPSRPAHDGSFRSIRVRVPGKGYTVRARPGYYARAE